MIPIPHSAAPETNCMRTFFITEMLLDRVPLFPPSLRNLQSALEDCNTGLERACSALREDPGVHRNFVRLASLAAPGSDGADLGDLVRLLGKRRAWSVAVVAFLLVEIDSHWSSPAMRQVAKLGRELGYDSFRMARLFEDDPQEQPYVSGLLSVMGLLPLIDTCEDNEVPDWIGTSWEAINEQRELFGTDYLELGRWIRLLWNLPAEAIDIELQDAAVGAEAEKQPSGSLSSRQSARRPRLMAPRPAARSA